MTDARTLAHIVRTGRNGELDDMTEADVHALADRVSGAERIVLHFHGGLNSRADGEATAGRWLPIYEGAGAHSVFFVWESGFIDTIGHNLDEIARDEIFAKLLKWLLKYAVGKVRQDEGARAVDVIPVPPDREVNAELATRDAGREPYEQLSPADVSGDLTDDEAEAFRRGIEQDADLQGALEAALATRHPATTATGTRGLPVRISASGATLLDPAVLEEMEREVGQQEGSRGLISAAFIAKKACQVLVSVLRRYRAHTDSGVYPTVLEELLRAFYLANAGGAIWNAMKKETADTFEDAAPPRGGRLFLDALAQKLSAGAMPEITLVGHSTGAVFIDNFLGELARGAAAGDRNWPDGVKFQVVLLAPAATFRHMTDGWPAAAPRVRRLRMFTMYDTNEQADHLVGSLYPRSLLYFVCGVVERDRQQESVIQPLVGLNRYYGDSFAEWPDLTTLRDYMGAEQRVVWSPTAPGSPLGRRSQAVTHTGFNTDTEVAQSVAALVDGSAQ